jgi:hypothetical protein
MKKKDSNPLEKKKKILNIQKDKAEEKQKDKKLISQLKTKEKSNPLIQSSNNAKFKRNVALTEFPSSGIPRKKSEQKNKIFTKLLEDKNPKKDKPRVLSHSPDKLPAKNMDKPNMNKIKSLQQKTITDRKLFPSVKADNMKSPSNLKVPKENLLKNSLKGNAQKRNIEKKTEENKENLRTQENALTKNNANILESLKTEQGDQLQDNYNPNLYGFNLYKHVKENLRNKDKLCKDKLTKESYYCLDCKLSTCKKCPNFSSHKGHTLIPKYLYYDCDENIFKETFKDLDQLFKENPEILDNNKLKEDLKSKVRDTIDELITRLVDIKNKKLQELDALFESTDGCVQTLKEKEKNLKNDLRAYLEKQKDFYYLQVQEEKEGEKDKEDQNKNDDPNYDVLKNLQLDNNGRKAGMIESNNDTYNSTFLISYDLFKNASFLNNEIKNLINDIQANRDKYLTEYNMNLNQLNEDTDRFSQPFNGVFNYRYLTNEFYKMIYDKLKKYNEKIDAMRRYIYDMVNKDGNFDKIDKDNRVAETGIKQRFDNILNYQLTDKDDAPSVKTKNTKGNNNNLHRLSLYFNTGLMGAKFKSAAKNANNKNAQEKIYEKPEDIKLDKEVLQKYFAYEAYNTIHNNFRYKKPKKENEIEEEFDEDLDVAKPIPGTNEMQIYDRKTTTLTKRAVKFDKSKHKYTYFLNGCRSVLVKDMLYILGGVDKEKNTTKMAYVYYLKTNELKVMPEMLKPHAYHSVDFLDYYKSIIVLGGENSVSCELYDLNTGLWRALPDLNVPRAHCNLYLDKFAHAVYVFFGVIGDITEKHNYTDVIEVLELKRLALGWCKLDYNNRAEMDFKSGYNKILALSPEMILIYGATNMRDFVKKAAVYIVPKFEIVKIDNNIFREIKETSKHSRKLSKILSSYI